MLDHELFAAPAMRAALAQRDISRVYRLLNEAGVPQRTIAELVVQSQSEVSEILKGRQVMAYDVLVRICTGLGIPRGWMGLAYDEDSADVGGPGQVGEPEPAGKPVEEVDEAMKRRALLAVGSTSLLGSPVLGQVLHIPTRPAVPTPLPSRVGASDVAAIRALTSELRGVARTYGGCAEVVSGVAQRSLPLMSIPGSDVTKANLGSALAQLHNVAGWCCVDSGFHDNARAHFATAVDLAQAAGDGYQVASAFRHAGIQMCGVAAWDDGLKAYQLGQIRLGSTDSTDVRGSEMLAWLHGQSASPLAAMGRRDLAVRAVSVAREHPMTDPFDAADMDGLTSSVYYRLGQLDIAEQFAASAVRLWSAEGSSRRDSVEPDITLAAVHAQAGEPDSAALAHRAITSVSTLRSVRARQRLDRLIAALETRPGSDLRELARRARQVASTRV